VDEAPTIAPLFVVIGCGNLNRSDDAAGVRVIQQLRTEFGDTMHADVRLFDAGTGGLEVMFQARGARRLIIVDASRSDSEPGAIFRLPGSEIGTVHEPAYSLHSFRWDHAVHAGRRIFGAAFPSDMTVYLIEAGSLELGTELTAPVGRAVCQVCEHIAQSIREWRAELPAQADMQASMMPVP
jgi:hydrogenase maturation protease